MSLAQGGGPGGWVVGIGSPKEKGMYTLVFLTKNTGGQIKGHPLYYLTQGEVGVHYLLDDA